MINFQRNDEAVNEQEAFTAYLIKVINPKDTEDFENKIKELSESEINELYKQFKSMEEVTFAKLGSKLEYLNQLRNTCPEGYEVEKYLSGGCVKCRKKANKELMTSIKEELKCGGKMKKRKISKKALGNKITKLGPGDSTSVGNVKLNKKQSKVVK